MKDRYVVVIVTGVTRPDHIRATSMTFESHDAAKAAAEFLEGFSGMIKAKVIVDADRD